MSIEDDKKRKHREVSRRYYEANREKVLRAQRQYKEANRKKISEASRRYREANVEKLAEADRRYRESHREEIADYVRRYREVNREKVAEYDRRYRKDNPQKAAESSRQWLRANPEKNSLYHNRRRVRKAGVEGSHTEQEWQALKSYYMDQCLCCGDVPDILTRDHIIPIIKGGSDNLDNLQPLCVSCNSRKSTRIIDYR